MNEKKGFFEKLFGSKQEKTEQQNGCACGGGCSCGGNCASATEQAPQPCQCGCSSENTHEILILGSGCKSCQTLEQNTKEALQLVPEMNATIGHITDFAQIAQYGVMSTPALVVDGKVLSYGRVLSTQEVVSLLKTLESNA